MISCNRADRMSRLQVVWQISLHAPIAGTIGRMPRSALLLIQLVPARTSHLGQSAAFANDSDQRAYSHPGQAAQFFKATSQISDKSVKVVILRVEVPNAKTLHFRFLDGFPS